MKKPEYALDMGFKHFGAGLIIGLSCLASGLAIGVAGDATVRAYAQTGSMFVIMIMIMLLRMIIMMTMMMISPGILNLLFNRRLNVIAPLPHTSQMDDGWWMMDDG